MTEGWDEIEAAVYAVVLDVLAVEATLVPEVLLELLVDVVSHWLPAREQTQGDIQSLRRSTTTAHDFLDTAALLWLLFIKDWGESEAYHSVLFTASPNPGVSTMVSFSLTPFSSISTVCLVISTVCVIRSRGWKQTEPWFQYVVEQKFIRLNKKAVAASPSALSSFLSL